MLERVTVSEMSTPQECTPHKYYKKVAASRAGAAARSVKQKKICLNLAGQVCYDYDVNSP